MVTLWQTHIAMENHHLQVQQITELNGPSTPQQYVSLLFPQPKYQVGNVILSYMGDFLKWGYPYPKNHAKKRPFLVLPMVAWGSPMIGKAHQKQPLLCFPAGPGSEPKPTNSWRSRWRPAQPLGGCFGSPKMYEILQRIVRKDGKSKIWFLKKYDVLKLSGWKFRTVLSICFTLLFHASS